MNGDCVNGGRGESMQTLHFVRVATKAKDSLDGLLYIHQWETGFQELIFNSKESAENWIKNQNK